MSRQNPAERAEASRQRLDSRQKGLTTQLNNRINTARTKLNARDSRQINQLVGDLTDLGPELPPPTLRKEEPRGPIPAARGYLERNYQPGTGEGGTAGIASPLTEGSTAGSQPQLSRTYHPTQTVMSTDGLFVWEVRPVATLTLHDANGSPVEFRLAIPSEVAP